VAQDRVYLTFGKKLRPDGTMEAVISQGHPHMGDAECTVLAVELVKTRRAGMRWYNRMLIEQPWKARH
jgi:hypothetical protein